MLLQTLIIVDCISALDIFDGDDEGYNCSPVIQAFKAAGGLWRLLWKSKLLLAKRVIVRRVISIVTRHKRFLLDAKMGNSWKVFPPTLQLLDRVYRVLATAMTNHV